MTVSSMLTAIGPYFGTLFALLSLLSVAVVIWRYIKNVRAEVDPDKTLDELSAILESQGGQAVHEWCVTQSTETESVVPRLVLSGIEGGRGGKGHSRDAMLDCIELELLPSLQRGLAYILLGAKVAPMLGLLGTVWGMISAFQEIAGATRVEPSALAEDIGMALFTTAFGLLIAIPLIFAYTLFRERLQRYETALLRTTPKILDILPQIYGRDW